jgi:DNA-binding response OmpR family regulator
MINILLAEDDFDFGSILKQYLEIHQFAVEWAKDGEEALQIFKNRQSKTHNFDICVFDIMMPKMDGFSLAEKVIEISPEIPFLFLTAKNMKADKLKGLKLGADDYIVKPFEADLLVLRLQNILKRAKRQSILIEENEIIQIGAYQFDPKNFALTIGEHKQKLTEKEAQLIQHFYTNKNQMIKREELLRDIWKNDDFFSGRSMDVFISRLRKYFKMDPNIAIVSTRGIGLTFQIT